MRSSLVALVVVVGSLEGCAGPTPVASRAPGLPGAVSSTSSQSDTVYDNAGSALFEQSRVSGSFVLLDLASGKTTVVGREDAARSYPPCSTFKIPNTLIGLETGVIPDEHFALKWDGKRRQESDEWNRDHDLASAMKYSVVWFYQEVARRIGEPRMQQWVHSLRYGNESIAGGIDHFWLGEDDEEGRRYVGGMRISPLQQVDFLRRLRAGEMPVSAEHFALVKRILPGVRFGDVELRDKSGLGVASGRTVGWVVGYAERSDRTWIYATHVDADESDVERVIPLRRDLTHALLARYGVIVLANRR